MAGPKGLVELSDDRFDSNLRMVLEIPDGHSNAWFAALSAECEYRGFSLGGVTQSESAEHSGTLTVAGPDALASLIWEWATGGQLRVSVRRDDALAAELGDAAETRRLRGRELRYVRSHLEYFGRPWRGEYWLDRRTRLSAPAVQAEAVFSPQVVWVDLLLPGFSQSDAGRRSLVAVDELAIFLSVVLNASFSPPRSDLVWSGLCESPEPRLISTGYFEKTSPSGMPAHGATEPIAERNVSRPRVDEWEPDYSDEMTLPSDTAVLWTRLGALSANQQDHWRNAARAFRLGLRLFASERAAAVAIFAAAIEALKPRERAFDSANMYDVIESLLGRAVADNSYAQHSPQAARSAYVHRAEHFNDVARWMIWSMEDPAIDERLRWSARISAAAILAWLERGWSGLVPPLGSRPWRRDRKLAKRPT